MADPDAMWEDNNLDATQPGQPLFWTDTSCILCSICSAIAPETFGISSLEDHCVVHSQPSDAQGLARCREAEDNCPVEAIGITPPSR